jgi:hypothetical protein
MESMPSPVVLTGTEIVSGEGWILTLEVGKGDGTKYELPTEHDEYYDDPSLI